MTLPAIPLSTPQEAKMSKLMSNAQSLAAERSINQRQFEGLCYAEGLSLDTARKVWEGDTNVNAQTLGIVAKVLGVDDLGKLINFGDDSS